jgi:ribosomal protein L40E
MIDGLEPTRIDNFDREKAPVADEVVYNNCPRCNSALADPSAAFCDTCGGKIPRAKKKEGEGGGPVATKRCRRCGFRNPAHMPVCKSCGQRI